MKNLIIINILLVYNIIYAQSFVGSLVYKVDLVMNEINDKSNEMLMSSIINDDSWADTITYYYLEGNYFQKLNNKIQTYIIYNSATNKLYNFNKGVDSNFCSVMDASYDVEYDKIGLTSKVLKIDTSIYFNNMLLSLIRIEWKSGYYNYYYDSTDLYMDPIYYKNHNYDGFSNYLLLSKSLPIKIEKIVYGMPMAVVYTLISKKKEIVEMSLFNIPNLEINKEMNIIKSNYILYNIVK